MNFSHQFIWIRLFEEIEEEEEEGDEEEDEEKMKKKTKKKKHYSPIVAVVNIGICEV